MSDTIKTVGVMPMPRKELLARAKELQAPRSFATGALAGLTLYLRNHRDEEVLEMLKEGLRFCALCQRDLEAYKPEAEYRFLPGKGPRYYTPSEVVSKPDGMKQKVERVKDILESILDKKPPPEKRIKECHSLIKELLEPYRREAAVSLGEFKYGPTLRR